MKRTKLPYDKSGDAAYLRFSHHEVAESEEISDGVVLDFDKSGRIVGIELLGVSRRLAEDALQPHENRSAHQLISSHEGWLLLSPSGQRTAVAGTTAAEALKQARRAIELDGGGYVIVHTTGDGIPVHEMIATGSLPETTSPLSQGTQAKQVKEHYPENAVIIRRIAYDLTEAELFITFVSGHTYAYSNVPQVVYEDFIDAPSKGRYFAVKIRGSYPYVALDSDTKWGASGMFASGN